MQTVSQEWKDNQNQRLVSESFVEISLDLSNPDALTGASVEASSLNGALQISEPEHVIDGTDRDITTYATLEQNLWLLDGSRKIIPTSDYEDCGYIGYEIGNQQGGFTFNPVVDILFSSVQEDEIPGISITWSEALGDYPRIFTVTAYNGNNVVATKKVTDNTDVRSIVWLNISGYDCISINVQQWCLPFRRARIENILTGISMIYTKNDLFSFSHSQEIDPISASLPQSGVSFSVDNTKNTYNPDNADGLSRYLTEKQEVNVKYGYKIGDKTEWIKCGTFYLSDWKSKENSRSAEFSATDIFESLSMVYTDAIYYAEGRSLYDLAVDVLTFANLPLLKDGSVRWVIDESLKDIIATVHLPRDTVANCLQYIANAGECVLYADRMGMIHIEKRETNYDSYVISPNNSFSKPEKTLSKHIKQITVNVYHYNVAEEEREFFSVKTPGYETRTTEKIVINHDGFYTNIRIMPVGYTGDDPRYIYFSYDDVKIYGTRTEITYTVHREGEYHKADNRHPIHGHGYEVTYSTSQITIPISNEGEEITIDNPLIDSEERANAVGQWIKNYLSNRQNLSLSWRADPRLDAFDTVEVQGTYNTNNALITKVEYTYNGAFRGSGEGRVV
jgi:hypothetical protein